MSNQGAHFVAIYSLPHPDFFSQSGGVGGHVSHAIGDVQGLRKSSCKVVAVIPEGAPLPFRRECYKVIEVPRRNRRFSWNNDLLGCINKINKDLSIDFIYMRYSAGFSPWIRWLKKKNSANTPLILEVNSLLTQHNLLAYLLDRAVLKAANCIVTISNKQADFIRQIGEDSIADKIYIMPNAVDCSRFKNLVGILPSIAKTQGQASPLRIGYVGILKYNYGLELLLDAYIEIRKTRSDVEIIFCGEGPLYHDLVCLSEHIPGVVFTGAISFDTVPSYLQTIDIAVYPATRKNNFQSPVKIYEYMAAGCSIIAARMPETVRLLEKNKLGVLYEAGDRQQLIKCLSDLLNNADKRNSLGKLARHHAKEHTWGARFKDFLLHLKNNNIL